MHLLKAQPGAVSDGSEAVDSGQTPGDIVFLSAADTDLASLAAARARLGSGFPELRLANLMALAHPMSVDLYLDRVVTGARLVVARVLGGIGYWPYGVEQLRETCAANGIALALLPGDDQPDPELTGHSSLDAGICHRLWQYGVHGGPDNAEQCLRYAATLIGRRFEWREPVPLQRAGLYWPGAPFSTLDDVRAHWVAGRPVAALVFYRALVQAGNLAAVDALVAALGAAGVNALPLYCQSLKDLVSAALIEEVLADTGAGLVLNATGFAVSAPGAPPKDAPFTAAGCPVLQVVFSGGNADAWRAGTQGLSARDIAMNVALPEVDGRVLTRAVSFKGEARWDEATESAVVAYQPEPSRVRFVAALAAAWLALVRTPRPERRIALVLANYPNRDGRIGNGVGLDTPAATVNVLGALATAGYRVEAAPSDGNALVDAILTGPTNAALEGRVVRHALPLATYRRYFETLPAAVRDAVTGRWGPPERDPFYLGTERDAIAVPALVYGNVAVGLQPARGYNVDPKETYHSPDLVPPHGYLAFYAWLRDEFGAHALVHVGKHGNLEWLPGKALALSEACYPEAALGPMPHVYPFIVNDPGEGTQAKRRAQAVIVDHLTPPLTRAEAYGPLADLERLVDEYYEAAGVDPRRLRVLTAEILDLTRRIGLDRDCAIEARDDDDTALAKLDNYLCELKEMQIRNGLHVLGESPEGGLLTDLLVALTRVPRGDGMGADASLLRALAHDLGLDFDPLDCELGAPWTGARPDALAGDAPWRTHGDTVERLEILAARLVAGEAALAAGWSRTAAVLAGIEDSVRPAVEACGRHELEGLLVALDARFLEPGPSGAPTRGRLDVLPTGRNFYSVDTRVVPTPAAWHLGWKSAAMLVERYRQEHGEWPRQMALSAWGTSNMRTGGDDIAQGLALMGVRPTWDTASRRVTGFEILPADILDRPRVDVTLRVSGFFRDAFPGLIDLFDSAARAVAALDEGHRANPLADRVRAEAAALVADGVAPAEAARRAGFRVFGSKPGAYGAGLQALIDERGWRDEADLARAYLAWGGYAYGDGAQGQAEHGRFRERLRHVDAIVHNQDNREHDLLDSDDYYQFEGGLSSAVAHLAGERRALYHNDHSRPESPKVRRLEDEIGRVVRARAVNPKWIEGVMRHGYKGAFEMAATVDYLFAFAATTGAVGDHHFDAVFEAYLDEPRVREFLEANNPGALHDIAERLLEAQSRGLWRPRLNSTHVRLRELSGAGGEADS